MAQSPKALDQYALSVVADRPVLAGSIMMILGLTDFG